MCGIAGYYGKGNEDVLIQMTSKLKYRGPDDSGFFANKQIGLGHTRLSIIDLSPAGHQPMSNEKKNIWIVFNGEIYNFQKLREDLIQKGYKFKSSTDTEVIIYLYQEYGENVFSKLDGMFAIAIYDNRKEKMILARDRMGKKPLYWSLQNNTLIFGSELKALMAHPEFKKELSLDALNKYLFYEYIPTPQTIFKNTHKLEPGTSLTFDGKSIDKRTFWDIKFASQNIKEAEAIACLDKEINDAVKKRLVSDAPLGIFLSGGIDSSTICYYAQKNSQKKIKTFSIGFSEKSFDESKYAREVAQFLGTEHHEEILDIKKCVDIIPEIFSTLDEPMADASIIPTYLLSKFAHQEIKVALGGDGGDELFMGYDTFIAERFAPLYEMTPKLTKKIISQMVNHLPTSFSNISLDFKAKKFLTGFSDKKEYRHHLWLGSFNRESRKELFSENVWQKLEDNNEFDIIDKYLGKSSTRDYKQQLILLYLRTYLMDDILVKTDRASMFNSLEVRTPLLDHRLVNFVNSLPSDYKIKGSDTKYILKQLMKDKLPKNILSRKKKGFGMPVADWLSQDLKPLVLDLLSEERIRKQGLFNHEYIKKLLNDHFTHKKDNRKQLWTLLVFQMWHEKWLK